MDEKQKNDIEKLIKKYGSVKKCVCGGYSVPSRETFVDEIEEYMITLINFPVFSCTECEKFTYNAYLYFKYRDNAWKEYENNGNVIYNCDIISDDFD